MKNEDYKNLPLVYSCSGCSNAAQLANDIAVSLDQAKIAEMSCIAGVGSDVISLVKTAKSGREIIAIDGCPLGCAKACLAKHNLTPKHYIEMSQLGIKKKYHEKCDQETFNRVWETTKKIIQ